MLHYYKLFWLNAFNIHGRSRRKEFWYPVLVTIIITMLGNLLITVLPIPEFVTVIVSSIFNTATFVASTTVAIRRFHDLNMTMKFPIINCVITIIVLINGNVFYVHNLHTPIGILSNILEIICLLLNICLLITACGDGHKAPNKYGESPKYA
ncbi:DUF805 domain-containing protein [Mammaliicoccus sciuri]|uniref:DUF805 domain-containing protein n=1 Tax=Mammaliicoccus sciuri TaxID=1296 RepID=UPI001E5587B8|nr:DUF805 domain-containing protein [Mammaliicoccus sciuri]MCD8895085.1 DUF805 domain-containing protein [Mammaliicoccus sciuri]MCD8913149.1 DUF805 domain-containing protein [Mammaliicoccus sciuri]